MQKRFSFLVLFAFSILFAGCGNKDEGPVTPTVGPPTINSVTPSFIARGLDHEMATINGTNFTGVTAVDLGNGITVHSFTATSANAISLDISTGKSADVGPRTVTVTTPLGTANASGLISLRNNVAPNAVFAADPPAASTKIAVKFDASDSSDPDGGKQLSFRWEFGDGATANGKTTMHKFSSIGTFNVSLTVTDGQDSSSITTQAIEILSNAPPVAAFSVDPEQATTLDEVEFDATKSYDPDGKIKSFLWDLGDGKKKIQGSSASRKFEEGTYTVSLTVTDNNNQSATTTKELKVKKVTEIKCARGSSNHGLIFGTVVGNEGASTIVQFSKDRTCANTYYRCGDLRKAFASGTQEFYGIITNMYDLGNGKFKITNKCPLHWPPQIGSRAFLIWKSCGGNFCP